MAGEVTSKIVNDEQDATPVVQDAPRSSAVMELDIDGREEAGLRVRGKLYPYRFDLPLARMMKHQQSSVRIGELADKGLSATDEVSELNEDAFNDALPDLPDEIRRRVTAVTKLRIVRHWLSLMYSEVVDSPLPEASSE